MLKAAMLCLFAVALGAYLVLWPDAPVLQGDSPQYLEVARDLADWHLDAVHIRSPGYPALLVLTGSSRIPARSLFVVSLVLHFASIGMLAWVLQHAGVRHGWVAVFCVLLLLPPYVEPAAHVMTENLAQFTLAVGFACLAGWFTTGRKWLITASALAFGLSSSTRPIYQALGPVLAIWLAFAPSPLPAPPSKLRNRSAAGAMLLGLSLLMLFVGAYANWVKFGFFGVNPALGFHLSTKTMSFVERLPDEYATVRDILVRERNAQLVRAGGTHTGTQAIWSARSELETVTGLPTPDLSRYLVRMNVRLIAMAPIEYLQEVAQSIAGYWFPAAGPVTTMGSRTLRWTWVLLHFALVSILFMQLVVAAGITLFYGSTCLVVPRPILVLSTTPATPEQIFAFVTAGIIVFYNMLLSCAIDIGEPRQRRPTELFLVFMCVLGAHVWHRTLTAASGQFRTMSPPAHGC